MVSYCTVYLTCFGEFYIVDDHRASTIVSIPKFFNMSDPVYKRIGREPGHESLFPLDLMNGWCYKKLSN